MSASSAPRKTLPKAVKYGIYVVVMIVTALPLFGYTLPKVLPSMWLLVIHEFASFIFIGHTVFSNIWSMRIRQTQDKQVGVWARAFIRKMAFCVTMPTTIIVPVAGLMLINDWGGLGNAPWAYDAYLCFWLVAAISVWPDLIRLAVDEHADEPTRGMLGGAVRGIVGLVLSLYILLCMITKQAWITG